jgi:protein-S-isoprenylcysteine O-methyltransferase Ste14
MRTAALALFWGFTAYAFVVRSGLQKLATGDTGVGASLLLFATLVVQVRLVEEPHLARVFGPDYAAYARRTGRFVPGVGLLR